MIRAKQRDEGPSGPVISIIGPGMRIDGDCVTEGTIRIEGSVTGMVHAGKAVVIGKDGSVHGDVSTQDAVISGRLKGTLRVASRLEIQATARIDGEIRTRRLQLEEGAVVNGEVRMGEVTLDAPLPGSSEAVGRNATTRPAPALFEG